MKIKLFVSDIDGTLLVPKKKISARNINAVKRMTDAGITVTIATGRMYRAALPIAQELGVNVPIITYNGALIKSVDGEIIYENCLPENLVVEIVKFYEKRGWHLQSYSEDILYVPEYNKFVQEYEASQKVQANVIGWEGMKGKHFKVCKMLSIAESEEENLRHMAELKAVFGNKIDVTKSAPIFTEIVCPNVSKASAVTILAEKLGVVRAEVLAIGDADNDLPMLKVAGISVAMGNATEEVKKSCDLITGLCEDDGFAQAVDEFVFGRFNEQ
ncbi:MAG: HAD family phosphatase [Selenomonadaceae bacterium]|nr:HAD family phosphatase [Selenomonadaceae bacterium]